MKSEDVFKEVIRMSTQEHFDLVILGSGSTAFAVAVRAQELGKTVVMTEEWILGGPASIGAASPPRT
jgi:glycerol-3-phosphate dehydrogenase